MKHALLIPAALAIALGFHAFEVGRFLQRTLFSMWLHELGHAVAAWLCGRLSFPGPWFTPVADEQSWLLAGLAAGLLAYGAWQHRNRRWVYAAVLAVQLVCTLLLPKRAADAFILWGGDVGAQLFACGLMGAYLVVQKPVRYGLLVIGAAAFVDVFAVWWAASSDFDLIPYGANEGIGASDPSRLADDFGWSSRQIVNRFLGAGIAGLVALGAGTAWAVWSSRRQSHPRPKAARSD